MEIPFQKVRRAPRLFQFVALGALLGSHILSVFAVPPPTGHFHSRLWQTSDGLPHNVVTAVAQTSDGYLWVGTQDGVARFDGVNFVTVDFDASLGLKSCSVSALCQSTDGAIWVATMNEGLLQLKAGRWSHFTMADGLAGNSIRTMLAPRDGSVWIGTTNGLSRFQHGRFETLGREHGLTDNVARCLYEDATGKIWIGTGGDVICFAAGKMEGVPVLVEPISAKTILAEPDGTVWLGRSGGLFEVKAGKQRIYTKQCCLVDNAVTVLTRDRSGNLWIGTYGGLSRRTADGRFIAEITSSGASFDQINAITEDQEGNIWLGTRDGLQRLTQKAFTTFTREHALSHNNIMSIYENKPGHFWIGTWGGGLNWMRDGTVTAFSTTANRTNGLNSDLILGLLRDRSGHLWLGTDFGGGLYQIDNGRFIHYGPEQGLTNKVIRVIVEDRDRNLWLGTSSALVRFKDGQFHSYTTENGMAGNAVRALLVGKEGELWVGTETGLSRFANGQFTNFNQRDGLSDEMIFALLQDQAGDLWIGTQRGGLNRFRDGKFTAYTTAQGLFQNEILDLVEDDRGFLWMTSLRGIFRVNKTELNEFDQGKVSSIHGNAYGQRDGILNVQCNGVAKPGAWKAFDGRLWFATIKGVAVVDPTFSRTNSVPPPVYIEKVIADKKRIQETGDRKQEAKGEKEKGRKGDEENSPFPLVSFSPLLIPPGRGELEFHFTALSFQEPEGVRFKCRLEGADSDWVDCGNRRSIRYNNIKPGQHTFRVIACNNDGVWNSLGANVKLTLQPHYWQTWWFKSLAAFACLSLAATSARYLTKKRMQSKLERLEQQHAIEKERTRIARDMHDDLGARLTEILVLSNLTTKSKAKPEEVATHSGKISVAAQEVIDNLHSIVWAVNPGNDSLEKLWFYIREFTQSFLESSSIRCRFDFPDMVPKLPLSSEVRHNLFLVVKEAMNNIVKHAQASEVTISLLLGDSTVGFKIADNGRGFQPGDTSSRGNGLQNMEKRMQSVGGSLELKSEPGKGTRLHLQIPLHRVTK